MSHSNHIEIHQEQFTVPKKAKTITLAAMVIGIVLTVIGVFMLPNDDHAPANHVASIETNKTVAEQVPAAAHENAAVLPDSSGNHEAAKVDAQAHGEAHAAPHAEAHAEKHEGGHEHVKPAFTRFWTTLLTNGYFFLLLSVGGLFFVCVNYVSNSGWSAAIKRVPEAMLTFMPIALAVILIVAYFAKSDIYHWSAYENMHLKKSDVGYDKILAGKSAFLNSGFYYIASFLFVAIWFIFGLVIRKISKQEDLNGNVEDGTWLVKMRRLSAGFTIFYGFSFSVFSWLIIMSIDAHWYSTIFGVYNFATGWVSTLTVICFLVLFLKSQGYLKIVSDEHLHDIGKFMFAFTIFWGYIWLSQYLLIWYAHLPEEVAYYHDRFYKGYYWNFILNVVINFLIPFLLLMTRNAKRNPKTLLLAGTVILLGHYHDTWLMIAPGSLGTAGGIGAMEIGMFLFFAGLFSYWVLNALTKRGLIAINHPFIIESANHDVGP